MLQTQGRAYPNPPVAAANMQTWNPNPNPNPLLPDQTTTTPHRPNHPRHPQRPYYPRTPSPHIPRHPRPRRSPRTTTPLRRRAPRTGPRPRRRPTPPRDGPPDDLIPAQPHDTREIARTVQRRGRGPAIGGLRDPNVVVLQIKNSCVCRQHPPHRGNRGGKTYYTPTSKTYPPTT